MSRPPVPDAIVLQAAARLFEERGYQATTTAAIAEAAGVNEATLFRKFSSKKGVLVALAERWKESMAGMVVERFDEDADVSEVLAALAELEIEGAESHGVIAMRLVIEASGVPEIAEAMGSNPHDNLRRLAEYLARRQKDGSVRADVDATVMAEAFFAMTSTQTIANRMLRLHSASSKSTAEKTAQIVSLFCEGVLTRKDAVEPSK